MIWGLIECLLWVIGILLLILVFVSFLSVNLEGEAQRRQDRHDYQVQRGKDLKTVYIKRDD